MKAELTREKRLEHVKDEFIETLIYHSMWSSDLFWETIGAITEGLKSLKYSKDKLRAFKDNI